MAIRKLDLGQLPQGGLPGITPRLGAALAEAAAVCLDNQQHKPGVEMPVNGSVDTTYSVYWPFVTEQQRRTHNDLQEATESGASSIACLLTIDLTEYTVIERSRKGTGFDYWLAHKDDSSPVFQGAARLEVSGILSGDSGTVKARVRQKCEQVKTSDSTRLPSYIVVVEFSNPTAAFVSND